MPLLYDERFPIFLGYDRRIQRAYEGTVVEYNKRRGRDGLGREEEEKYSSHHYIYEAQNYNSQEVEHLRKLSLSTSTQHPNASLYTSGFLTRRVIIPNIRTGINSAAYSPLVSTRTVVTTRHGAICKSSYPVRPGHNYPLHAEKYGKGG